MLDIFGEDVIKLNIVAEKKNHVRDQIVYHLLKNAKILRKTSFFGLKLIFRSNTNVIEGITNITDFTWAIYVIKVDGDAAGSSEGNVSDIIWEKVAFDIKTIKDAAEEKMYAMGDFVGFIFNV